MHAPDRLLQCLPLIEVTHQLYVIPDRISYDFDCFQIICQLVAAKANFDGTEITLGDQFLCFLRELVCRQQPQSVGIVGAHLAYRAAEHLGQRQSGSLRQRIPDRHVEACCCNHADTLTTQQMQRADHIAVHVQG